MPVPVFWIEFYTKHGRPPRAEELSDDDKFAAVKCFKETIKTHQKNIHQWRKMVKINDPRWAQTTQACLELIDEALQAVVEAKLELKRLRGESFVSIFTLT